MSSVRSELARIMGELCGVAGGGDTPARDTDGLPIGVQIVGRAFAEESVLAIAKKLEQSMGGFQRPSL
jgi:Asp-tRNA(Asn)/Glu-tRNA(Gln) amidotransferase A subunit family amidase